MLPAPTHIHTASLPAGHDATVKHIFNYTGNIRNNIVKLKCRGKIKFKRNCPDKGIRP